jgi:SagB-type dehydrogenase family enzyme
VVIIVLVAALLRCVLCGLVFKERIMKEGIGDIFQRETKYQRGKLPGGGLDWGSKPDTYKRYGSVPKTKLPPPSFDNEISIWEVMKRRRSVREFREEPLSIAGLSQILWVSQGITQKTQGIGLRAAPSAGALYPIETYLVINNVSELEPGVYHYAVETQELEQIKKGDFRNPVARAALDQEVAYFANVVFVWTAVFDRSKWKYKQRAYRYVYLDAGHIAQNVALGAVALGLGSCQIAALYDEEANGVLGVDGINESTIYMTAVGKEK